MPSKKKAQAKADPAVTVERVNQLVDVIVPLPGCEGEGAEAVAVALALVELANMTAGKGFSFRDGIDNINSAEGAAYYIARRAFTRTPHFEDALEDWQDNTVEAALGKGGDGEA